MSLNVSPIYVSRQKKIVCISNLPVCHVNPIHLAILNMVTIMLYG